MYYKYSFGSDMVAPMKTFGHIYIHKYKCIFKLYTFIYKYIYFYHININLLTIADVQFYAILQVKFFSSPRIAWREEFEAEIQIHGIYILPIESIHTRVGRWMEEIHQSENWEIFFPSRGNIYDTFLASNPLRTDGKGCAEWFSWNLENYFVILCTGI